MDVLAADPRREELDDVRGVEVDLRELSRAAPRHRLRRPQGGDHLLPDLVAATENRGAERDDEAVARSEGAHPLDRGGGDPGRGSAPAGMDRGRRSAARIDQEERHAIGAAHGGNHRTRAPARPEGAVGRDGRVTEIVHAHDRATMDLSEDRERRVTETRGRCEPKAPGAHPRVRPVRGPEVEIEPASVDARAERVRHAFDGREGLAPREDDAVDLVEAPAGVRRADGYFTCARLLTVAWTSAASRARGSRSTYFCSSFLASSMSPVRRSANPRSR